MDTPSYPELQHKSTQLLWHRGVLVVQETGRVMESKITLDDACRHFGPVRALCRGFIKED